MKRKRLCVLYKYYLASASEMLDRANQVKQIYLDGEMSYRRAWRELDRLIKLGTERVKLCEELAELLEIGKDRCSAACVRNKFNALVAWTIA